LGDFFTNSSDHPDVNVNGTGGNAAHGQYKKCSDSFYLAEKYANAISNFLEPTLKRSDGKTGSRVARWCILIPKIPFWVYFGGYLIYIFWYNLYNL
jgi:hypothetical protein